MGVAQLFRNTRDKQLEEQFRQSVAEDQRNGYLPHAIGAQAGKDLDQDFPTMADKDVKVGTT